MTLSKVHHVNVVPLPQPNETPIVRNKKQRGGGNVPLQCHLVLTNQCQTHVAYRACLQQPTVMEQGLHLAPRLEGMIYALGSDEKHLGNEGHKIIWNAIWIFTNLSRGMCSDRVKIAQQN